MTRGARLPYRRRKRVLYRKSQSRLMSQTNMSWTCNSCLYNIDALDATVGFPLCQGPSTTRNRKPCRSCNRLTWGRRTALQGHSDLPCFSFGGFDRGRTILANQRTGISQHISCFAAPDQPTFRQVTSSHNRLDIIGSQYHNDDHDDNPFPLLVLDASFKDTTAITGRPRRFESLLNSMVDMGHPAPFDCSFAMRVRLSTTSTPQLLLLHLDASSS
ncbi:hypothetical protein B0T13DRAFT_140843 [Neurospora crassa]|nr:hypothetical protein B0T13DRAFT_140843 [Neurospora crassa]